MRRFYTIVLLFVFLFISAGRLLAVNTDLPKLRGLLKIYGVAVNDGDNNSLLKSVGLNVIGYSYADVTGKLKIKSQDNDAALKEKYVKFYKDTDWTELISYEILKSGSERLTIEIILDQVPKGYEKVYKYDFTLQQDKGDINIKGVPEGSAAVLGQNYPNAFNPATWIPFTLAEADLVNLTVYNVLGEEVAVLVNEFRAAGPHNVLFNAANLPSGIYIYRLTGSKFSLTKKMLLMK